MNFIMKNDYSKFILEIPNLLFEFSISNGKEINYKCPSKRKDEFMEFSKLLQSFSPDKEFKFGKFSAFFSKLWFEIKKEEIKQYLNKEFKEGTNILKIFEEEFEKISEEENSLDDFKWIKKQFTVIFPLIDYNCADFELPYFSSKLMPEGVTPTYEYTIDDKFMQIKTVNYLKD